MKTIELTRDLIADIITASVMREESSIQKTIEVIGEINPGSTEEIKSQIRHKIINNCTDLQIEQLLFETIKNDL